MEPTLPGLCSEWVTTDSSPMKKKKHIGQLVSVHFSDRKTPIYGYVIDYSDDWTLLKHNPVDFIVDGYVIVRHKNVAEIRRSKEEKWKEQVMNLKGLKPTGNEHVPLTNLETILQHLTEKAGVFQLYTKSEKACYLGRLHSMDAKVLVLDNLNTKGQWDGQITFKPGEIRVVEFDTDYSNSLMLVNAQNPIV